MPHQLSTILHRFLRCVPATVSCALAVLGLLEPRAASAKAPSRMDGEEYSETRQLTQLDLPVDARNKLNSDLMARITEIDRVCKLLPAQREKLRLMGQGDVKHFFDLVRKCKRNPEELPGPRYGVALMLKEGIFHERSLFGKSIQSVLDPKQLALRAPLSKEVSRGLQENAIKSLLDVLQSMQPFKAGERDQFVALLKKFPPPETGGEAGLLYLIMRVRALAKKQPDKVPKGRHLEWMNEIEGQCKALVSFLQEAGYLSGEVETGDN